MKLFVPLNSFKTEDLKVWRDLSDALRKEEVQGTKLLEALLTPQ